VEVDGDEHARHGGGGTLERARVEIDRPLGTIGEFLIVRHLGEAEQVPRGDGICGGLDVVAVLLQSKHQVGVGRAGAEVPAGLIVGEQAVLGGLKIDGKAKPLDVERRLVEVDQRFDVEGVVFEEPRDGRRTVAVDAGKLVRLRIVEVIADEARRLRRRGGVARLVQDDPAAREG
jgi:hypothetical protein